jgi:hypothetical protein
MALCDHSKYLVAQLHLTDDHRLQFPPAKFLPALQRLSHAHAALKEGQDWLQPKGVGVVCIKPGGIAKDSFVHFYFGKMCVQFCNQSRSTVTHGNRRYSPSKWFERESAIEAIKAIAMRPRLSSLLRPTAHAEPSAGDQGSAWGFLQHGARSARLAARRILPSVLLPPSLIPPTLCFPVL